MLATETECNGRKLIARNFPDRDLAFIKLLAQKITRRSSNAVALLATTLEQPALVFAQSPGLPFDMATLMKQTMAKLGGRYGGSKDMAQGGVPTAEGIEAALCNVVAALF
jgi:alanyl-tRNA synthetase